MPRLSVHMPAYNAAGTIRSAAKSVLRDLPSDSELVILDDGSTDETRAVVESITDPRVRLLSGAHEGVGRASQSLLEQTDSELVARMDSDDIWLRGRYGRQVRALESGNDAVFTTIVLWGSKILPRLNPPTAIDADSFPFHLLLGNPVAHSTMMAKRSTVVAAGGYRPFRTTEDYDLFLRIAQSGARLRRLALPGLAYRLHANQTTASDDWRRSSWQNVDIGRAYSQLAEGILGLPAQRITTLAIDDTRSPEERRQSFRRFAEEFGEATARLTPASRWSLRRKLAERSAWLESRLTREGDEI